MARAFGLGLPRVSQLVVDADLTIATPYKMVIQTIQAPAGAALSFKDRAGSTVGFVDTNAVKCISPLSVDHIGEYTAGHKIYADNFLSCYANMSADTISVNHLTEADSSHGIRIASGIELFVDHIREATGSHGITLDNSTDLNGHTLTGIPTLYTDHISQRTAGHGVTIDHMLNVGTYAVYPKLVASANVQKEIVATDVFTETDYTAKGTAITIPAYYLSPNNTIRYRFGLVSSAAGVVAYGKVYKNGVAVGTERSVENTGSTFDEDFTNVSPGDVFQVYCKRTGAGSTTHLGNHSIRADESRVEDLAAYSW